MALLALLNQDILLEVFQHVGRQRQSSETHDDEPCHNDAETQTLARCARVCRAFREPSLRVLWEYLPSVLPLLQLLAPHFRKLEHGREGDKDWGEGHEYDTYVRAVPAYIATATSTDACATDSLIGTYGYTKRRPVDAISRIRRVRSRPT